MRWQNLFVTRYFAGLLFFVRMSRKEAKETISQPCIFLRKALLSLSFTRCNPAFPTLHCSYFYGGLGKLFLSKSLSNFHSREKNGSNQPNGNSNPGFFSAVVFKKLFAVQDGLEFLVNFFKAIIQQVEQTVCLQAAFWILIYSESIHISLL